MKNLILVFWFGLYCQNLVAQNNKPLQISEFKIPNFYQPLHVLMDNNQNSYVANWFGNGQTAADTVNIYKISSSGKLIKNLKIVGNNGALNTDAMRKISEDRFVLALTFFGSITVQNQFYKVRLTNNNQIGVQGCILIIYNTDLEIVSHKLIGYGVNVFINSLYAFDNKSILLNVRFTDTLDTRPIGENLHVVSETDTVIGEHLNFAVIVLDSNLESKGMITSNSQGTIDIMRQSGNLKSNLISAGTFSREDSLNIPGIKIASELDRTPFILKFNTNLTVKWILKGTPLLQTGMEARGAIQSIAEDKLGNYYTTLLSYDIYKINNSIIGFANKFSTSLLKFDSLGNILWVKNYPTFGGYFYASDLLKMNPQRDKLIYCAALQDTFSIGNYTFSIPSDDKRKGLIVEFDLDGNVMNIEILGYNQHLGNGIDVMTANMDSSGNTYACFTTQGTGEFKQDCFTLPELTSLENDSSRVVWLKFGPSTLKKDSIFKQWDICIGQGQIEARYKTKYPDLEYKWNTQPVDSAFSFSQGGNYRLIVKDATCYADTNYFSFAPQAIIPQPSINGSSQTNNIGSFLYHISVPDSLQINWQVAGGQIVSGQGTDSVYVNWSLIGQGFVSYTLTGLQSGCQQMDTLNVLITSNNSINKNSSQFRIYPNPTDNLVTISRLGFNYNYYNLSNFLGQSLMDGFIENGTKQLDLTNLESGIYILTLKSGTTKETIKVVKN